jgi:hypothetical protein
MRLSSILALLISVLTFIQIEPSFCQDEGIQTQSVKKPAKALFTSHEILHLTLTIENMKELEADVGENPGWHKGSISYQDGDSLVKLDVKLQARGHYRKDPANCNFPPLRVNFKKKQVPGTIFEGQDKLKLVNHCRKRNDNFDQYVLKEYLAYRIYNVITERSFRVRLLSIHYVDKTGRSKPGTHYGFCIEDTRDMAERNGFTHIKVNNIPQEYCDYFYQDILTVFQFMIGNTDWSIPARHNIKLLLEKPDHRPVPVPYDFDWSGLVNPVYAKPSQKLGITSVEHRLFRGFVKNIEDYNRVFEIFTNKKPEIDALISECPLNEKHKHLAYSYLNEFYEIIADEKKIERAFIKEAREPNAAYWGK